MHDKKRILITGGAGYIGSHIAWCLHEQYPSIVLLDNLSTGYRANVQCGDLHVMDLADYDKLDALLADYQPHAVIHAAGSIVVPESIKDPLKYYTNNTVHALNLIQACHRHGVTGMVFSSTAAVYGMPSSGICDERTPTIPIHPYGHSKRMTEQMLMDLGHVGVMNHVIFRYFNVAGAHPNGTMGQRNKPATHLLAVLAEVIAGKRDRLCVFGNDYPTKDGTCIRDYIHVLDLANAHHLAVDYLLNGGASTLLNAGYATGISVQDMITVATQLYGDIPIEYGPRRDGDPPTLIAQASAIRRDLGWIPEHADVATMIESAVAFETGLTP